MSANESAKLPSEEMKDAQEILGLMMKLKTREPKPM